MSIGSKLGNAFDSTMDWVMEGSMPWAMTKLIGASAIALGVIMSPFIYTGYQNSQALQDRIESLDSRPTAVFNSVAQCTAKGYTLADCQASKAEAEDIAGSLGTSLSYSSSKKCEAVHGSCKEVVTHGTMMAGKVVVPTTNYSYHPYVKAWQTAQDNLKESVPLYQSARDGILIRTDGAQFPLP